jgi:hypothetical protein
MYAAKDKEGDQEKNTLPRNSHQGRNTGMPRRRCRRQRSNSSSSSGIWPGGGHRVGAINSSAYSRAT